jgi:prepilin-type N-terminal cleavage/methylation domain-containing protein/prepilin-type processing-associated H-X9-DG protein
VMARRRGFTLIELLVVIAIIGILAAMLFPVFARARESARKIQCLSNVKNIAMAVQMYLGDYDRMPPTESRPDVIAFYDEYGCGDDSPARGAANNPYLRFPVVLDEYIKNRDVWSCPSARSTKPGPILNPYYGNSKGDWFLATKALHDEAPDCTVWMQCNRPMPPGWGGTVTDSYAQQACSDTGGGFESSIGIPESEYGLSLNAVNDPARYLSVCETGPGLDLWMTANVAYPDLCHTGCATTDDRPDCTSQMAQWENCPDSQSCGAGPKFGVDSVYRKTFARHMGGVNLGFMDGHAKWMASEAVLFGAPDWRPSELVPDAQKPDPQSLPIEGPVGVCFMIH